MQIGEVIHGFRIEAITEVEEVKAVAYKMVHEKTNAQLLWLKRDDDNKTFSIAFKTTPTDDTGVFHILEHSVLNGSKRYPVKEPFVDLMKGSLNTFLNAMTFPDKTVYPVSSRNSQDFKNLMRVYLDAVFAPLAVEKDNVFRQEGWHYELNDVNDTPCYKGVVYNEMKGSYSNPERVASENLLHYLFPDNCYSFASGGDPEAIPTLTYEKYCQTYHKYYHASNSRIFLDGDLDIEETLQIIDDEYLSKMDKLDEKVVIEKQQPVNPGLIRTEFEATSVEDKALINYGYVIGDYSEVEKITALQIISSVLADNNQSVLTKAVLESGLAQDVSISIDDSIMQPYLEIAVTNTNEESYQQITDIIYDTIEKVCEEGLDKEEIKALLNKMEFSAKERDFGGAPKGLVFDIMVLGPWLHDGDPLSALEVSEVYKSLREKVETSYYEDLLRETVLNSKHKATVLSVPSLTLEAEKLAAMNQKMKDFKASLTAEQVQQLVDWNQQFSQWQQLADTPEQKAALPKLEISDIDSKPTDIEYEVKQIDDITTLVYPDDTDGINYNNLYFNIDDLTVEQLKDLAVLASLIGDLNSKAHSVPELSRARKNYLGSLEFSPIVCKDASSDDYCLKLAVSYSCLKENNKQALEIVKEMLYDLLFDDVSEITNSINQEIYETQMRAVYSGHQFALSRVQAMSSEASACNEYLDGYEFYQHLKKAADGGIEDLIARLQKLYGSLFTTNRLTLSVMGPDCETVAGNIIQEIVEGEGEISKQQRCTIPAKKEGIKVASQVSYAVSGFKPDINIRANSGKIAVAGRILSLDYLWNVVRAMGGAYGTGFSARNGCYLYYSYRDPNPANALKAYQGSAEYLQSFVDSDSDITPYIIGAIGDADPLLTNRTRMAAGDGRYFSNSTYENRCLKWQQILNMDNKQVAELVDSFKADSQKTNICIVGPADALESIEEIEDIIEL